jgi:glutathione synthase/RimK-type ligase-like ATP-grasp enzyme
MNIVIIAHENDNHAAPIQWAAEQAGYKVTCWSGLGWTGNMQASILFNRNAHLSLGLHHIEPGDVVWFRRLQQPEHNPHVSEPDRKFAETEYKWFSWSVGYLIETLPVRCINRYSASRFINNKAVQLRLAGNCGMNVPATLMSNSPDQVKAFLQQNHGSTICKPFFPHIWKNNDGGVAVTETFVVTPDMLPSDEALTFAPAIYQQKIVKSTDIRMVLMGSTIYSYSVQTPTGSLDWRYDAGNGNVLVEEVKTPSGIENAVLEFARRAGISFGSFDFAVDAEGRWWFLEVNEQGQFLWLDVYNPAVNLQQKFLAFLILPEGASRQLIEERQGLFPSYADYENSLTPEAKAQRGVEPETDAPFMSREKSCGTARQAANHNSADTHQECHAERA